MKNFEIKNKYLQKILAHKTIALIVTLSVMFIVGSYLFIGGYVKWTNATREYYVVAGLESLEDHNFHKAQSFFLKATKQGATEAYPYLAWVNARIGNFSKALEYSRECAKHRGISSANEIMGYLALLGYGNAQGANSAIFYFNEALKDYSEEYLASNNPLLKMYENSINYAMNTQDYIRMVNEAKAKGSKIAILARGDIDFLGMENVLSPFSATKLYNRAKEDSVPGATSRLAAIYWHGYGVKRDIKRGYALYKEAAKNNDPVALYSLALIYLRQGTVESQKEGMRLLKLAAKGNYGPALTAVGVLALANGFESKRIREAACDIFKQAYNKDDSTGGILYAFMILNGYGTGLDKTNAYTILYRLKNRKVKAIEPLMRYLNFNQKTDYNLLLSQTINLCRSIYLGEVAFTEGAPEAQAYVDDSKEHSGIVYYTKMKDDKKLTDELIQFLGRNYVSNYDKAKQLTISGQPLVFDELYQILDVYNPTSGAKPFLPKLILRLDAALPPLPKSYEKYGFNLDDIKAKL